MAWPGTGKAFEESQSDDLACRRGSPGRWGQPRGVSPGLSTAEGAGLGTLLGAGLGAAIGAVAGNPGLGAAVGAGGGLRTGTAVGAGAGQGASPHGQHRYDNAYSRARMRKAAGSRRQASRRAEPLRAYRRRRLRLTRGHEEPPIVDRARAIGLRVAPGRNRRGAGRRPFWGRTRGRRTLGRRPLEWARARRLGP